MTKQGSIAVVVAVVAARMSRMSRMSNVRKDSQPAEHNIVKPGAIEAKYAC